MTILNDFLHFFFNILGNKHPNNTNTGIRISQMNFLAHENVETHPPRGGILWYQNIFPLANTFAKRENVRPGQSPTGTQMVSITALFNGV